MWVFEGVCAICAKSLFLNSLDVPIKMFANSLAVLNQQTLGGVSHKFDSKKMEFGQKIKMVFSQRFLHHKLP